MFRGGNSPSLPISLSFSLSLGINLRDVKLRRVVLSLPFSLPLSLSLSPCLFLSLSPSLFLSPSLSLSLSGNGPVGFQVPTGRGRRRTWPPAGSGCLEQASLITSSPKKKRNWVKSCGEFHCHENWCSKDQTCVDTIFEERGLQLVQVAWRRSLITSHLPEINRNSKKNDSNRVVNFIAMKTGVVKIKRV